MPTATYYFDGSDAAASDPNAVWTNDSNAFDGDTGTNASCSTNGSVSSNYLQGDGTDAPTTGGDITLVRARIYGNTSPGNTISASIYTDALGELLGTPTISGSASIWSNYTTLSTPTGGWTWQKLANLEAKLFVTDAGIGTPDVARVELEVTYNSLDLISKNMYLKQGFQ